MYDTIAWFDRHDPANEPVLGGKNTSLGIMTMAGLPVPNGFALTAQAYRRAFHDEGLDVELTALMSALDVTDTDALRRVAERARGLVVDAGLPAWLDEQLEEAYAVLSQRCAQDDVPVAVRSSATCEDQPDASFAGEHDTYLWVRSPDRVKQQVLRCWASLYTERAIAYRRQMNYPEDGAAMSVGVQQMVNARAAGVAFTLNPLDGDRSQVAIDAAWGLGEGVVSGSVTPDNYLVDKVVGEISRRTVSDKATEFVLDRDQVTERPVDEERRRVPCLSDEEIKAVAALARRAEKHYGCPQDTEWAIDPSLPEGENVVLLQSRPETVWSRRTRSRDAASKDTYASIVHTLLHPAGSHSR